MVTWPSSLPDCPNDWSEGDRPIVLRSEVDVGPGKVRRRMTRATTLAQAEFRLTTPEWQTLREFFRIECQSGAGAFDWPHPITKEVASWRFREPPATTVLDPIGIFSVRLALEEV